MNKYCKIIFGIFALFTIYSLFFIPEAGAAELFFESGSQKLGIEQQFQVDLFLDTEDEEINAIEGKVIFPENLLELKEVKDGATIVNFWIERPRTEPDNQIIFSGIIPGGYIGQKGLIFSTVFQSKKEGEGIIEIRDAKVLLNDGKGTQAPLSIPNFQFLISKQTQTTQTPISEIKDIEPPESFVPEIASSPALFDGKWFLIFVTQDKGIGIDHYEVKEAKQRVFGLFSKWALAESPYVLKDQELRSYIFVKAIDKVGNSRIVSIPPQNPLYWYRNYENWLILLIIIIGFVFAYLIKRFLWRKNIKT